MKTLVIGDPHFKYKKVKESEEYVTNIVNIAIKHQPTFIVILGDVLDTHEIVRVQPHKLVTRFLKELSDVAHTYVLIGNHDYINNSQFLTDNHIFNPFKEWNNVTIVDKVLYRDIEDKTFVFVPYVPKGKFIDALDTLIQEGETWELADCIFAHQEFRGCKNTDTFKSKSGDVWDSDYPLVISGHIHIAQNLGENIKYPGSSMQHFHHEPHKKYVWIVEWGDDPKITKISVGMKQKKLLKMDLSDLENLSDLATKDGKFFGSLDLRINLTGTSAEFKNFKTSDAYSDLVKKGVTFSYELKTDYIAKGLDNTTKMDVRYDTVLQEIVSGKSEFVKREYKVLFGDLGEHEKQSEYIELNFISETEENSTHECSRTDEEL